MKVAAKKLRPSLKPTIIQDIESPADIVSPTYKLEETKLGQTEITELEDRRIAGWLEKQSKASGFFSVSFKCRYVVCESCSLRIYGSCQTALKAFIDFRNLPVRMTIDPDNTFTLRVATVAGFKSFVFRTSSKVQQNFWVTRIQLNMQNLHGLPVAPANFWKLGQVTNAELLASAETGDILLFTSNHFKG